MQFRLLFALLAGACVTLVPLVNGAPARIAPRPHPQLGIMLATPRDLSPRAQALRSLGVEWFRPLAIFLGASDEPRPDIESARRLGLRICLVVRNGGSLALVPSAPPDDLRVYRARLRAVLRRYRPDLLVVENEPDNPRLYYTGTPAQYAAELRAAREVAHAMGIPCADGGLTDLSLACLAARRLLARGRAQEAVAFARRVAAGLSHGPPRNLTQADLRAFLARHRDGLDRAEQMLVAAATAGPDYLNLHWYVPDREALVTVVAYMRSVAPGLPLISNEMGQRDDDAAHTAILLETSRDLGLRLVIWYSVDMWAGAARSLFGADGSLRDSGRRFGAFARSRR